MILACSKALLHLQLNKQKKNNLSKKMGEACRVREWMQWWKIHVMGIRRIRLLLGAAIVLMWQGIYCILGMSWLGQMSKSGKYVVTDKWVTEGDGDRDKASRTLRCVEMTASSTGDCDIWVQKGQVKAEQPWNVASIFKGGVVTEGGQIKRLPFSFPPHSYLRLLQM